VRQHLAVELIHHDVEIAVDELAGLVADFGIGLVGALLLDEGGRLFHHRDGVILARAIAAAATPANIPVATMAKSCVDTLVFTLNLRIGWLARAGKPTPEISHKRGNHPLRLPFPWAGNGRFWRALA